MVSRMAMEDIDDLVADGIGVTPEQIVQLNALAVKAERSQDGPRLFASPRRCTVGAVTLYEPTVQVESWMADTARDISGDEDTYWSLYLFACAHARIPGYFEDLPDDPLEIKRTVQEWFARLNATQAELKSALKYVLWGPDDTVDEIPVPSDLSKDGSGDDGDDDGNPVEGMIAAAIGANLGLNEDEIRTMTVSRLGRSLDIAFAREGAAVKTAPRRALAGYFRTLGKIRADWEKKHGGQNQDPSCQ